MESVKEYPRGYGCIRGSFGHWECDLSEWNLDSLSPIPKPPKSEEERKIDIMVEALVNYSIKRLNDNGQNDDKQTF